MEQKIEIEVNEGKTTARMGYLTVETVCKDMSSFDLFVGVLTAILKLRNEYKKNKYADIKEGDIVTVSNTGEQYTTYKDFFLLYHIAEGLRYDYGERLIKGDKVKVIAIRPHGDHGEPVCVVEKINAYSKYNIYLIGIKGLEKE